MLTLLYKILDVNLSFKALKLEGIIMKQVWAKFILVMVLLPFSWVVSAASAESADKAEWIAGKHYKILPYPVRTRDASKVEVVELFWYGCPHCYKFNPIVHHWSEGLADDVDFWLSPATFGPVWTIHAQAFYAAEVLGVQEKMHQPLFDAIVRDRKPLSSEAELARFFAGFGIEEAKFKKAFKSFSVKSKVDQANARAISYRATGVPALIVNGKYRISSSEAGSNENMLKVADFLIEKERATLGQ
ncbi:thiol:disulfide interchange protein DsbA/DsbL [Alkalimarinus alittae]|uniref:Thiol:disulfide interchange protein DsbA n=1 Tax=Alkalimarinus alittae TaxID=2961619 RepID=A0ABY6N0W6_9ALTE|nr:thiol:disulfide interchange protein DsbA/DsbL [Alkalimarinus alittae]UZE95644.1 thiol:disulfide interchange protein DsbA/DsbL [Alkalimarinus alittae]